MVRIGGGGGREKERGEIGKENLVGERSMGRRRRYEGEEGEKGRVSDPVDIDRTRFQL